MAIHTHGKKQGAGTVATTKKKTVKNKMLGLPVKKTNKQRKRSAKK